MRHSTWSVETAGDRLEEVIEAAESGGPQLVVSNGRPSVYVVAAEQYERWVAAGAPDKRDLVQQLLAAPPLPEEFAADEDIFSPPSARREPHETR